MTAAIKGVGLYHYLLGSVVLTTVRIIGPEVVDAVSWLLKIPATC